MNLLFLCVALIFAEKFHFHPHLVGYGQRFPRLDDMLNSVSFLTFFSYRFFQHPFAYMVDEGKYFKNDIQHIPISIKELQHSFFE